MSRRPTPGRRRLVRLRAVALSRRRQHARGHGPEDSNATGINGNQSDNSATESGAAYVFTRSGTTWSQQAYVKASNTGAMTFRRTDVGRCRRRTWRCRATATRWRSERRRRQQRDRNRRQPGRQLEVRQRRGYVFTPLGHDLEPAGLRQGVQYRHWAEQRRLHFGTAVALSSNGNVLLVGSETGVGRGDRESTATTDFCEWDQRRGVPVHARWLDLEPGPLHQAARRLSRGDQFGHAVAFSSDGSRIVIGAWNGASNATGINGSQNDNSVDVRRRRLRHRAVESRAQSPNDSRAHWSTVIASCGRSALDCDSRERK